MAALTKDMTNVVVASGREHVEAYKVKAGARIYLGATVAIETATGMLVPAANTVGLRVIGVSMESIDNVAGANGSKLCQVMRRGRVARKHNNLTDAHIEKKIYVLDDATVTATPGNSIFAGVLVAFEPDGRALIFFDGSLTAIAA